MARQAFYPPWWIWPVLFAGILLGCESPSADPAIRPDGRTIPGARLEFRRFDGTVAATIAIEIADTPEARAKGLMGRRLPDHSHGLLFVFADAAERRFWMRDTPESLDIIFIREDGQILNIAAGTQPMADRSYASAGAAKYVLEVKAGFARRYRIGPGTRVHLQAPQS